MKKERDYTSQSIAQTAQVLEAVAHAKESMSLMDVVKSTGINQNTVFRILWNLDRLGWVQKVGDHYRLGMKLALFWARYKSRREAERDAIDKELTELEVEDGA